MNNHKITGIATGLIATIALIIMLNNGTSAAVVSWPLEAYLGVAFSIGWTTPAPNWLAYILAIAVFILVFWLGYKLGSRLYRLIVRH